MRGREVDGRRLRWRRRQGCRRGRDEEEGRIETRRGLGLELLWFVWLFLQIPRLWNGDGEALEECFVIRMA